MSQNKPTIDTLISENYTTEQSLTYQNRKTIAKMFNYIRTFPLGEYETELIRKDILGMAAEAEQRSEPLENVIGKDPRMFCDDLLDAIAGIHVPKGRIYLRIAGWFFQVIGWWSLVTSTLSLCAILLGYVSSGTLLSGEPIPAQFVYSIISSFIPAILYIYAGNYAKKYSGVASRADTALKWGIGILLFTIIYPIVNNIIYEYLGTAEESRTMNEQISLIISSLFSYVFPVLYIVGAYMNKKSAKMSGDRAI